MSAGVGGSLGDIIVDPDFIVVIYTLPFMELSLNFCFVVMWYVKILDD